VKQMGGEPSPQGMPQAGGGDDWRQAQINCLVKISAQLNDIREYLIGILLAGIAIVLLLLFGAVR
jgi:hypothetical protein